MSDLFDYLPGLPPQYGLKQLAPSFSQGEDILLEVVFPGPIRADLYVGLEVAMKKNQHAQNYLWRVRQDAGMQVSNTGLRMQMPAAVSGRFLPGTYHVCLVGTERVGTGSLLSRTLVLHESMMEIRLSAASPNPKLSGSTTATAERDESTGVVTITFTGTESTVPLDGDATRN